MKKIISILLIVLWTFTCVFAGNTMRPITAYINDNIKIRLDGKDFKYYDTDSKKYLQPITYEGRTYLPVRAIGEALKVNVGWDNATQSVLVGSGQVTTPPQPNEVGVEIKDTAKSIHYTHSFTTDPNTLKGKYKSAIISNNSFAYSSSFALDAKYKTLETKIVNNMKSNASTVSFIDADTKLIIRKVSIDRTIQEKIVSINVEGVKNLKILFNNEVNVVDSYLYKNKTTIENSQITIPQIKTSTPIPLINFDMNLHYTHYMIKDTDYLTYENKPYEFGLISDSYQSSSSVFYLDGKYKTLELTMFTNGDDATEVLFYDADTQVEIRNIRLNRIESIKDVSINVEGIKKLGVRYNNEVVIANPVIYADKKTTENSSIELSDLYNVAKPNLIIISKDLHYTHNMSKDTYYFTTGNNIYKFGLLSTSTSDSLSKFNLNSKYNKLTGMAINKHNKTTKVQFIDIEKNTTIATIELDTTDSSKPFDINVSGVKTLGIKFNSDITIAEPYLQ